jgi:hypothetical protein
MAIDDPVHLQQPSGLAEVDIGTDGIPATPFVDNDEAKGLDVGEAGLVQVGVDEGDCLCGKGLCGRGGITAIATDESWRAPG